MLAERGERVGDLDELSDCLAFFLFWRYLLSFETLKCFLLTNITNYDCVILFSFIGTKTKQKNLN